jgi:hypothetical protein
VLSGDTIYATSRSDRIDAIASMSASGLTLAGLSRYNELTLILLPVAIHLPFHIVVEEEQGHSRKLNTDDNPLLNPTHILTYTKCKVNPKNSYEWRFPTWRCISATDMLE